MSYLARWSIWNTTQHMLELPCQGDCTNENILLLVHYSSQFNSNVILSMSIPLVVFLLMTSIFEYAGLFNLGDVLRKYRSSMLDLQLCAGNFSKFFIFINDRDYLFKQFPTCIQSPRSQPRWNEIDQGLFLWRIVAEKSHYTNAKIRKLWFSLRTSSCLIIMLLSEDTKLIFNWAILDAWDFILLSFVSICSWFTDVQPSWRSWKLLPLLEYQIYFQHETFHFWTYQADLQIYLSLMQHR